MDHRTLEPAEVLFLITLDQHNRGPNQEERTGLDPLLYAGIQKRMRPFVCNEVFLLESGYCKRPAPDRTGRMITKAFTITPEGKLAIPRFLRQAIAKARADGDIQTLAPAAETCRAMAQRLETWIRFYKPQEIAQPSEPEGNDEETADSEETVEETSIPVPPTTRPRRAAESVRESRRPPTLAEAKARQKAAPAGRSKAPSKPAGAPQPRTVPERGEAE